MLLKTSNKNFIQGLKTGVCTFALASMLIAPLPSLAANENVPSIKDDAQVQQNTHDETVISTANIPLATYPASIKEAVRLIDQNKMEEAKTVLQTALNTLVITEAVIPLPVIRAREFLKEAETLSEKAERTPEDNQRLTALLDASRKEIEMAQALGYGTKKDFDTFYKELSLIEEKTSGGKSGSGFFESIKTSMTSMFDDSQHEDNAKTSTN
ncbi:MAG: hypothetical protein DYH13_04195 [Alphaproteobacteria bacterium PRO2]|nr:hypothetical protein [Alphaproteobacteria bacterium PRO2]